VRELSERFDKWSPASFRLGDAAIRDLVAKVALQTIDDIKFAQAQPAVSQRHRLEPQGCRGQSPVRRGPRTPYDGVAGRRTDRLGRVGTTAVQRRRRGASDALPERWRGSIWSGELLDSGPVDFGHCRVRRWHLY